MKGNKRDIKKFFEGYFAKECPSHGKFYSWVLDLLQVEGGGKLLDIGCGNGRLLKVAETRGSSTYGIDISNKVAEASKEVAVSAEICVGDAESLPWKDNCFDYVVDIGTLQFLSDQAQGINEITRVLKKGGRVCIIAGNLFSWYRFFVVYRKGYIPIDRLQTLRARKEWEQLIEVGGLKIVKAYKVGHDPWTRYNFANLFLRIITPIVPLNLTHLFAFICVKN